MNRNRLNILLAIAAALALSGCGGAGEKAGGDNVGANAQSNVNAPNPAPTSDGGANVASANTTAAPNALSPATASGAAQQGTTQAAGARNATKEPPAKMPTPQIGAGGSDFFLFTQARAAVDGDSELRAANIIIDVKDGAATLSGKVASAAQKSKAEQLVRDAGAKSVKNQLRVGGN